MAAGFAAWVQSLAGWRPLQVWQICLYVQLRLQSRPWLKQKHTSLPSVELSLDADFAVLLRLASRPFRGLSRLIKVVFSRNVSILDQLSGMSTPSLIIVWWKVK